MVLILARFWNSTKLCSLTYKPWKQWRGKRICENDAGQIGGDKRRLGANRRRLAGMEIPAVARSIAQVDHKKPAKDRRERRKQGETAATQTIEAENVSIQTRCKKKIVFLL